MTKFTPYAVAILLVAGSASGSVSLSLAPVDNSSALSGYVTQDLLISTDSDWTAAALVMELSNGSIYQDPAWSSPTEPSPSWFPFVPTLEFDTYVHSHGGSAVGGAGDVGGGAQTFDGNRLDVSWSNFGKTDLGQFPIGRFTLSDQAAGQWNVMVVNKAGDVLKLLDGSIVDGVMSLGQVPLLDGGAFAGVGLDEPILDVDESIGGIPASELDKANDGFTLFDGGEFILNSTFPEPASAGLFTLAGLCLLRRGRARA